MFALSSSWPVLVCHACASSTHSGEAGLYVYCWSRTYTRTARPAIVWPVLSPSHTLEEDSVAGHGSCHACAADSALAARAPDSLQQFPAVGLKGSIAFPPPRVVFCRTVYNFSKNKGDWDTQL